MAHRTTALRVAAGLIAGALVGGALITVFYVVGRQAESHAPMLVLAAETPLAWLLLSLGWLTGMTLLGGPVWWLLHRLGGRGWPWLTALGALVPALVIAAVWLAERLAGGHGYAATADEIAEEVGLMVAFGAVGGVTGWTVWRVAYRREAEADVSVF
jgi:hypothetical protein